MNKELINNKYDHIELTEEQVNMFVDIIRETPHLSKILMYIRVNQTNQKKDGKLLGTTSADVASNVEVNRRVQIPNKKIRGFEEVRANITRKSAEKQIEILNCMSLLYVEERRPYKYHFLTRRGNQIIDVIKHDFKRRERER